MKWLLIVLANVFVAVLIGLVVLVLVEEQNESGEGEKVTMRAKIEPMVASPEEVSVPLFAELLAEQAMELPPFLEAEAFFPEKGEAEPIGKALIEARVEAEKEAAASAEKPKITAAILRKNTLTEEAMPVKEMLPANKMPLKLRPVATFAINVASFREKENADRYVDELTKKGIDAFEWEVNLPKKQRWYRVSLGSFTSLQEADNYREKLKQKGISNTWITAIPAAL